MLTDLDNRYCITWEENQEIGKRLCDLTKVHRVYTDFKFVDGKRQHFYCYTIDKFCTFPQFIGEAHEKYGRKVEIETLWGNGDTLEVYFRGSSKDLGEQA